MLHLECLGNFFSKKALFSLRKHARNFGEHNTIDRFCKLARSVTRKINFFSHNSAISFKRLIIDALRDSARTL